jgi:two-component system, response regulator / RNA-binding antiterminator
MDDPEAPEHLRVLVADHRSERLEQVAGAVAALGHEVLPRPSSLEEIGAATAAEKPDLAMVIVDESSEHSLALIGRIVREATSPVIAVLDVQDHAFVKEAAKRGIFAYITDGDDPDELQSSIDIALRRFAEYHSLEGAFSRRAVTERAKGILMERHSIDEQEAFNLLRQHARRTNRKIVDVAEAVLSTHRLLPASERSPASEDATL